MDVLDFFDLEDAPLIISRKDALARGLTHYFTGKPCKRGHVGERMVSSRECIECQRERRKDPKYREQQRQQQRKYMRQRRQDPEYRENELERMRVYNQKRNQDPKYREQQRQRKRERYQNDSEYRERELERLRVIREDPKYKERQREYFCELRQDPKYKERQRENHLQRMKDPVYRKQKRQQQREWRKSNPDKNAASSMKRHAAKLERTAPWIDEEMVNSLYSIATMLTESTGIQHHVDHIYPLQGKTVSGLHVETNLQVVTAEDNIRKNNRNRWIPPKAGFVRITIPKKKAPQRMP